MNTHAHLSNPLSKPPTPLAVMPQVRDNNRMNNVHLIILGVEGILLTWLSVVYMWHMAQEVRARVLGACCLLSARHRRVLL